MLRTRVISAIVLLPLVLGFLYLGGWWFFGLVGVALSVATWEYAKLLRRADRHVWLPGALTLIWFLLVQALRASNDIVIPGLILILLVSLVWAMIRYARGDEDPTANWAMTLAGGLYIGLVGANFVRLRQLEDGLLWSAVTYGSTWLADSAAFSIGRRWGCHKMTPRLSPGKSWEGYLAGLGAGALTGLLLAHFFNLGLMNGLLLGIAIAALSPIGDLAVSMIKRQVGAKDTSSLIPGHGGILDRIDSLLISVTIATYYVIGIVQ
jgi:phosphatidate cytidylyltransferase